MEVRSVRVWGVVCFGRENDVFGDDRNKGRIVGVPESISRISVAIHDTHDMDMIGHEFDGDREFIGGHFGWDG